MKITALAGGVGASKLLAGLVRVMDPAELTIVVNTGDDIELHGLRISPDLDIVTYTLAGAVNPETGWGLAGDTFRALDILQHYGGEDWFHLGDRDLATHIFRTALLRKGKTLSDAADAIRRAWGVAARILPMCEEFVPTMLDTNRGTMHFQEYLVKHRAVPVVRAIHFQGVERSTPARGVLEAIAEANSIIICPSNPLISIGPILAVPGIRDALRARRDQVIAVNPIVGGRSLKGPSDRMLEQLGHEVSAVAVARMYADFAGAMVVDIADACDRRKLESLKMRVHVCSTVMRDQDHKERLAADMLAFAGAARSAKVSN
ncbi:MAG TPA: 2-phospho-L-lactate transferase [Candidatus Nitrosotenuis sp.]|nr:2-phospho-L-lactate transferase [Candidatus Nitrosotenuis sp.]